MKKFLALLLVCALLPACASAEESGRSSGRFGTQVNEMLTNARARENTSLKDSARLLEEAQNAGSVDEAVSMIEQALALSPDDAQTAASAFEMMLMCDPEGQYFENLILVMDVLLAQAGSDKTDLLCQCVDAAAHYGRLPELLDTLKTRYEQRNDADYGVAYAAALYLLGEPENMALMLDALDVSGSMSAAYRRAVLYQVNLMWEKALDAYGQMDALWPDYALGLYGKYEVYKESGEFDRAAQAIDKMLALGMGDELWLERANIRLFQQYRPEEALEELDALLAYDPAWLEAKSSRVSALIIAKRYDEALEAADALKEVSEGYAALMRALVLLNAERWQEARDTLEALSADPVFGSFAQMYLSSVLYEGFDDTQAAYNALAAAFSQAAAAEDGYDAYLQLGHYYRRAGNLAQAATAYSCADMFADGDPSALYYLALSELSAGRGEAFDETLDMLCLYYPGYYETMLIELVASLTRGESNAALETYRAIEEKFPFCAQSLLMTKALLLALTGDAQGARAAGEAYLSEENNRTADILCDWAQTLALIGDVEASGSALAEAETLIESEASPYQARQAQINLLLTRAQIHLRTDGDAEAAVQLLLQAKQLGWSAGEALLWAEYPALSKTLGTGELLADVDTESEWSYYTQPEIPTLE